MTSEEPFSQEAIDLVDRMDTKLRDLSRDTSSPWNKAEFYFVGTTAGVRDCRSSRRATKH